MDIDYIMSIADKLQDLVTAKEDMKTALAEKGVTPTGGLSTYADAVREIENELDCKVIYVPEGINIGITSTYRYGESGDIDVGDFYFPDKIAFDISDNPKFKLTNLSNYSNLYTTNIISTKGKVVMVVDFKK